MQTRRAIVTPGTRGRFFHAGYVRSSTITSAYLLYGIGVRRCNFAGTPALYFAVDAVNKNMTRVLVKKLLPPWKRRRGGGRRGLYAVYTRFTPLLHRWKLIFHLTPYYFAGEPITARRLSKDRPMKKSTIVCGIGFDGGFAHLFDRHIFLLDFFPYRQIVNNKNVGNACIEELLS